MVLHVLLFLLSYTVSSINENRKVDRHNMGNFFFGGGGGGEMWTKFA